VFEPFQIAAFALPVSDLVFDEFERCGLAKIRDGKYRGENGLQADKIALLRNQVHLEEAVVGFALNLDKVWNLNRGTYLRKIDALGRLARPAAGACGTALKRIVDHSYDVRGIKNLLQKLSGAGTILGVKGTSRRATFQ
jgi:hypothetical protein